MLTQKSIKSSIQSRSCLIMIEMHPFKSGNSGFEDYNFWFRSKDIHTHQKLLNSYLENGRTKNYTNYYIIQLYAIKMFFFILFYFIDEFLALISLISPYRAIVYRYFFSEWIIHLKFNYATIKNYQIDSIFLFPSFFDLNWFIIIQFIINWILIN